MNPLERQAALARMRTRIRAERRKQRYRDDACEVEARFLARGIRGGKSTLEIVIDGMSYRFEGVGITEEEIREHLSALHEGRAVVVPLTARKLEGFARDMIPIAGRAGRHRCPCCEQASTHHGRKSGTVLMFGCSWYVRMWVRDPLAATRMVMRMADRRDLRHA